jgi:regulator of protease activity HflC (stomatin/prohibitin superfamily)
MEKPISYLIGFAVVIGILIVAAFKSLITIPAGHVGVAVLFGDVQEKAYPEGLHFPVNPLYTWVKYDTREKTHLERANVPSQDQLQTKIDVSVQYSINGKMASSILKQTGTFDDAVTVHLIPKLRSIIREQGKSIKRAEDFFLEQTQDNLQRSLLEGLRNYLQSKGINVKAALIRDITLPPFISRAIESKKEREQAVEQQKAELERFRTEQQQKIAAAQAERDAAEKEAEKRIMLADAQAYEIKKLNEAISGNKAYLQLQALEALKAISTNPSSKIYFLNGDSPMPIPLMHIGDTLNAKD